MSQGGISAVDGEQDLRIDRDLMAWNESSIYGLIILILDLYTDAHNVL